MSGKWLDTELTVNRPIPKDIGTTGIEGVETLLYNPLEAYDRRDGKPLDNNEALIRILKNTDIDILLRTIGNAFFPRVITVQTAPTLLIAPNRTPRGYIAINPNAGASGLVGSVTVFPVGTVFPVATTDSAALNVSGNSSAAFFLDITEATASLQIDLQTLDPISGNWATAQEDIFQLGGPGPGNVGTYYANVGGIGIDQFVRLRVIVAGDTMTGSIGMVTKSTGSGISAGATVFIGGPDVNTTIGFPIFSGQKETFYLKENTAIYAVATAPTNLNIFELQ